MRSGFYNNLLKEKNLWPSKKEESWKYFDFKNYELLTQNSSFKPVQPEIKFTSETQGEIKVLNNAYVVSEDLKTKLDLSVQANSSVLNKESNLDFRLTSLNLEGAGLRVKIKNQKQLDLKLVYELLDSDVATLHGHVFFDLEDVNLTLLEKSRIQSKASLFSNHFQMELNRSTVEHVILFSNESEEILNAARIYNSEVKVGLESSYKNTSVLLKNKLARIQQTVSLEAESSSGYLNAFNISEEKNFSELRTEILHLEPKTESRQLFKTIASDEATSIFNGRIFVKDVAKKTDAGQLCQGILLSPKAEINAKPELEIYADDVKAAHGAAIGQLGHDQIFYLLSRGIKPEIAFKMLSKAFAGEVLASIESLELRQLCQQTIDNSSRVIFEKLAESITNSTTVVGTN